MLTVGIVPKKLELTFLCMHLNHEVVDIQFYLLNTVSIPIELLGDPYLWETFTPLTTSFSYENKLYHILMSHVVCDLWKIWNFLWHIISFQNVVFIDEICWTEKLWYLKYAKIIKWKINKHQGLYKGILNMQRV